MQIIGAQKFGDLYDCKCLSLKSYLNEKQTTLIYMTNPRKIARSISTYTETFLSLFLYIYETNIYISIYTQVWSYIYIYSCLFQHKTYNIYFLKALRVIVYGQIDTVWGSYLGAPQSSKSVHQRIKILWVHCATIRTNLFWQAGGNHCCYTWQAATASGDGGSIMHGLMISNLELM